MNVWAERQVVLAALGYPSYDAYRHSPRWRLIRGMVLARDNHKCGCGRKATQVHHRRYAEADLLGETLDYMVAICRACHIKGSIDVRGGVRKVLTPAETDARIAALAKFHATKPYGPRYKKAKKKLRNAFRAAEKKHKIKPQHRSVAHQWPDGTWDVSATAGRFRT